ncbi:MAG: aminodeoxychorismate/anthranilate synthase component II [Cytophagales bacterium]|nr:MAG: aminodeoxychorismate/anthranilate synthase component II [Cytophagales bacterium]
MSNKLESKKKILLLDNFDSFTYILADYFLRLGVDLIVQRNNTSFEIIKKIDFDAVVLSPGPGKPETSGVMMELIAYYYNKLPILGICLGHQAIGCFFEAKLDYAIQPMHGKISEIILSKDQLFKDFSSKINVVRYHSLILKELPDCLVCIGRTNQDEVMVIKHQVYSIYGIQFHPEAYLTDDGLRLINNWLNIYSLLS